MTHVLPSVGSPSAVLAGSPSCRKKDGAELGAVTAEFAVSLPAVVLLLAFLLAGGAAGITQLRLQEAATAGARASARGETGATVEGIVRRLAGDTATSSMTDGGGWITVTVSSRAGGAMGPLIPWTLTASASARAESGGASSAGAWSVGSGAGIP